MRPTQSNRENRGHAARLSDNCRHFEIPANKRIRLGKNRSKTARFPSTVQTFFEEVDEGQARSLCINKAAADALKNILRTGTLTTKSTKAFGDVIDFKLPSGLGARFDAATNEFITFLGRGI